MNLSRVALLIALTAGLALMRGSSVGASGTTSPAAPASQPSPRPAAAAVAVATEVPSPEDKPESQPPPSGAEAPSGGEAAAEPQGGPNEPVLAISREALQAYARVFPGKASQIGIAGPLNRSLGDYKKPAIAAFVQRCKDDLARLDKVPGGGLDDDGRVELAALRAHLRSMIFLLETRAVPAHDPNFYVDESAGALQVLLDRDMDSRIDRTLMLVARMRAFPEFFRVARENLESCPKPLALRAVSRLRAFALVFSDRMAAEMWNTMEPSATKKNTETAASALKEIIAFAEWLEKERVPGAGEPEPLGAKGWPEWARSREDSDLDPAAVAAAATADMNALKGALRKAAAKVAKDKDPAAVLSEIASDRLDPALAREVAERQIGDVWRWAAREGPIEIAPEQEIIQVRETPGFRRRDFPIRTNLAGSFVENGKEAYLEIAPPDPGWPMSAMLAWEGAYGRKFLPLSLMRETYPGRFTAWKYMGSSKNLTCRVIAAPTIEEGWALYAEEASVRGGFGADDPKLFVAMLADVIRADARLIASVRLHALGAPAKEVSSWLAREAYWSQGEANYETSKLLSDPDRCCAALGRLEIIALRDRLQSKQGKTFSPRVFHARLLGFGSAPISASWRALAGGAPPPLLSSK